MKKKNLVKIISTSLLSIATVSGLVVGLMSCGSSSSGTEENNNSEITQTMNLLDGKAALSQKALGGYDSSLIKGKFYLELLNQLIKNNASNNAKILNVNTDGTFVITKEQLITILKNSTNVNVEKISDVDFLKLDSVFKKYQAELNTLFATNKIIGNNDTLTVELNLELNSSGVIQIKGAFKTTQPFRNYTTLIAEKLSDSTSFIYDIKGEFLPKDKIDSSLSKKDIEIEDDIDSKSKEHVIFKKKVDGYSEWKEPEYSKPMDQWEVGDEITVTFKADWLNDSKYETTTNKVITFEKKYKLQSPLILEKAYEKMTNMLNVRTLDNLFALDSRRYINIEGNFMFGLAKKFKKMDINATSAVFSKSEVIEILNSMGSVMGVPKIAYSLTDDNIMSLKDTAAFKSIANRIYSIVNFNKEILNFNERLTPALNIEKDQSNKVNFILKLDDSSKSAEIIKKRLTYIKQFNDEDFYDLIASSNKTNNAFFVSPGIIKGKILQTKHYLYDLKNPQLQNPKILSDYNLGFRGYSGVTVTPEVPTNNWKEGEIQKVTFTPNWANDPAYGPKPETGISFTQTYKVISGTALYKIEDILKSVDFNDEKKKINGYEESLSQGLFIHEVLRQISVDITGNFTITNQQLLELLRDLTVDSAALSLTTEQLISLKPLLNNYLAPINKFLNSFPSSPKIEIDILKNESNLAYISGKIVADITILLVLPSLLSEETKDLEGFVKEKMGLFLPKNLESDPTTIIFEYDLAKPNVFKKPARANIKLKGFEVWSEGSTESIPISEWKLGQQYNYVYTAAWSYNGEYSQPQEPMIKIVQVYKVIDSRIK